MELNDERYERQMKLPGFGEASQQKLLTAKVLVAGAGGLGCPALQYLAAAGVGTIGIADDDIVSLNNLHRQILYCTADIGREKAPAAKQKLAELNDGININTYCTRLTNLNTLDIIRDYDYVLDCTDNFATRYMINDACSLLKKPLVFGAIAQFEGQVAVFNAIANSKGYTTNYRDIFPSPPKDGEIKNCAEAGVLGVLPGITGTIMATETIKLITGLGKPLANQLLVFDVLSYNQHILTIGSSATPYSLPATEDDFKATDYISACATTSEFIIHKENIKSLLAKDNVLLVDVRELSEKPPGILYPFTQVPLSSLAHNFDKFPKPCIILFCQSGARSLQAARLLSEKFGSKKIVYSVKNGLADLK